MAYRITDEAKQDIIDIKSYLVREADASVANYVINKIRSIFRSLAHSPEIGHIREDLTSLPVKFWSVFPT